MLKLKSTLWSFIEVLLVKKQIFIIRYKTISKSFGLRRAVVVRVVMNDSIHCQIINNPLNYVSKLEKYVYSSKLIDTFRLYHSIHNN
jgi:hypothetical protein